VADTTQGAATIDVIAFQVEQLHSHAQTMPLLDKFRAHIHACLEGQILRLKQHVLSFFEGSSFKLCVARLADNNTDLQLAFSLGTHRRLGASSPLRQIAEPKLLKRILGCAFENAATSGILSSSSAIILQLDNILVSVASPRSLASRLLSPRRRTHPLAVIASKRLATVVTSIGTVPAGRRRMERPAGDVRQSQFLAALLYLPRQPGAEGKLTQCYLAALFRHAAHAKPVR